MKKIYSTIKLSFALLATVSICSKATAQTTFQKDKVAVIMHRGDWRNTPENSIQAITNSIEMGADMVEIDLKISKDSVLILMHDKTLDRTTNATGRPEDYTLAELKEMRLTNGIGRNTEHQIPTLEEAMIAAKGKIWINLDKAYDYFDLVKEVLEETGTANQVMIKSSHPFSVVKRDNSEIIDNLFYMPIVNANDKDAKKFIKEYVKGMQPKVFEVCFAEYNSNVDEIIELIKNSGSEVWINTLWASLCGGMDDDRAVEKNQEDETWGKVIDMGATFIQTDRPVELIEYLKEKNKFTVK